jgi:hypothetical protein
MPAITVPLNAIALGPGYLYYGNIGTALPANTVAGGVFTDAWASAGAWLPWGVTDSGHTFTNEIATDPVEVAEYLLPVSIQPTSISGHVDFAVAQITATNHKRIMNGGGIVVTGSGATTLNAYTPPDISSMFRAMLGWESTDFTERYVWPQCFSGGLGGVQRQKGANKATLPVQFNLEQPASGAPWFYWTANTPRG